jgi:uncharacterized membrane protein YhaH (DUF805 family)
VGNIADTEERGTPVDFVTAIKTCLSKYVDFSGRATRPEFWWFYLFQILVYVGANAIDSVLGLSLLGLIASLGLMLPGWAAGARRLHDINRSGWWQLIALTVIGILVLIYWFAKAGDDSMNDYGDAPHGDQTAAGHLPM